MALRHALVRLWRPCAPLLALALLAPALRAQDTVETATPEQIAAAIADQALHPIAIPQVVGNRPAILLTGYWPPSNEAVRRFSPSATQNPLGWIGGNWEGRGYDVYAYFPEFSPPTCSSCGPGTGDLQVDYQDTTNDFWPIVNTLQPIGIITFSRTNPALSWEFETNSYNFLSWSPDYIAPTQPTPTPPDTTQPANFLRTSTLPMQTGVDNVQLANLGLNAFICTLQHTGSFVSGYMGYHGMWYQSMHSSPADPARCIAAGHVHVGAGVPWTTAQRAAKTTLRTLIHHVDATLDPTCQMVDLYCQTSSNSVGQGAMLTTSGSTSITANSLRFLVTDAKPNQSGLLVYGPTQIQVPFGAGKRCIGGTLQRLGPIVLTDADGFVDKALDFTLPPLGSGPNAINAGSSWNFQFFYRDPPAGVATYNATNGAHVTFCP